MKWRNVLASNIEHPHAHKAMSVRGGVAKQHSSCHRRCRDCHSVTHVAVLVPDDPQEVEAESKQGCAQQVPQGCQVGDGKTVGVFAAPPHGMHHPVCYTQQQQHLEDKEKRWLVRNTFSTYRNPRQVWLSPPPFTLDLHSCIATSLPLHVKIQRQSGRSK